MKHKFLYVYVFLTGAAVMGTEMAASKLAAPYFGTSTIVWANIIGIILLAMSAGYFVGGKIADRYPYPSLLFTLSLSAGILLTLIPLITRTLFSYLVNGILGTPIYLIILTFVGMLLVFAPPIFILAMVSPFVLRLWAPDASETGKVAGRLNAFSTLGSIVGTFLPSLVLIPAFGTRSTVYVLALTLIAVSAWGIRRWWAFLFLLFPLLALIFNPHSVKGDDNILWEKETTYQYVQVVRQKDDSVALVYNEGGGVQSIARPNWALQPSDYYNYYLLLPFLNSHNSYKTWIIGSAGGTMLGLFDHYVRPELPDLELTGIEIDPEVIPLGQRFFGLSGKEGKIINTDGRIFLSSQPKTEKADLIIVDAYTQQMYIPFHLSTVEFYREVKNHLNQEGMMALNINAISASSPMLQAFQRTMASVFPYTYVLPVPDSLNYVLIGSPSPINLSDDIQFPVSLYAYAQYMQNNLAPADSKSGLVLTDDRAPVEFLTDQMVLEGAGDMGLR